jgi:hypothetical protein
MYDIFPYMYINVVVALVAQLVKHRHGKPEVRGKNPGRDYSFRDPKLPHWRCEQDDYPLSSFVLGKVCGWGIQPEPRQNLADISKLVGNVMYKW